jgi:hypothetical protein
MSKFAAAKAKCNRIIADDRIFIAAVCVGGVVLSVAASTLIEKIHAPKEETE